MANIFVFGTAVVDFIHFVESFPEGGFKHFSNDAEYSGGGTGANAAVAVSRLGGRAEFGARIGADLIAKLILDGLEEEGIDTRHVMQSESGRSPFSSVIVDRMGERQLISFRGRGLTENAGWLDEMPDCDGYLADARWNPGLERTLARARELGRPGVVDVERGASAEALRSASHIAFSRQGIQALTGEDNPARALKKVTAHFDSWICVTDGENGVYRMSGGRVENIPAFRITAKNTLGAGDVWHGAFTLRLAEGAAEDDAVLFANAAAAIKCTRKGGRDSFPRRDEVDKLLRDGA
ncbi:MAG: PfkB family carbohydrate kinase [Rhodobacteraceae bacterium]|nr:PfkB family carbohydrate kinase [Paracoccaceae bacterium]